jgi:hypothetical protein
LACKRAVRYEDPGELRDPGTPGSIDFRENGADVHNAYFLQRIKPRIGYTTNGSMRWSKDAAAVRAMTIATRIRSRMG